MTDEELAVKIQDIFTKAEATYPDNQERKWQAIAAGQAMLIIDLRLAQQAPRRWEAIEQLEKIADGECACDDQSDICNVCIASSYLSELANEARYGLQEATRASLSNGGGRLNQQPHNTTAEDLELNRSIDRWQDSYWAREYDRRYAGGEAGGEQ